MSTVLRAYGDDFDVDACLADCFLPVCAVKRRGEPVFPASQPNGRRHEQSGIHILVSDADFSDSSTQVVAATAFLRREVEQIARLHGCQGVEHVTLDFGIKRRDVAVQCDYLPPELIGLAGTLGLGIELSQYPTSSEQPEAEQCGEREPPTDAP